MQCLRYSYDYYSNFVSLKQHQQFTMKKLSVLALVSSFLFISCGAGKDSSVVLFGSTWELEYISGTRIAFEGLFPDKKPQITFNPVSNEVFGNAGCNGYGSTYTLNGNTLIFGEPNPTTMMYCEGGGEAAFLQMIQKVTAYTIDADGKLNLLVDEVPMMRFKSVKRL